MTERKRTDLRAVDVWTSVETIRKMPAMTCSHRRAPPMMATLQQQHHQDLCYTVCVKLWSQWRSTTTTQLLHEATTRLRQSVIVMFIFIARQNTDARYWYSNSVRLSVRDVPVSDENGSTYCHSFFTIRYLNHFSFISIKHLHEIPTASPSAGALNRYISQTIRNIAIVTMEGE